MPMKKLYSKVCINILMFFLVACNTQEEPIQMNDSADSQSVIDMFVDEGFIITDDIDKYKPDYKLSVDEAKAFLSDWKVFPNIPNNETTRSTMSSVPLKFRSIGGGIGIYDFEYKGIAVQFKGSPNMSNNVRLQNDAIAIFAVGSSFPLTQSDIVIKHEVTLASGYNHLFVYAYQKVTLEIEGVTLYQNRRLIDVVFVIDFASMKVIANEDIIK